MCISVLHHDDNFLVIRGLFLFFSEPDDLELLMELFSAVRLL